MAAKLAARPRDPVWLIRTYSGHSSAKASNELYRTNLARGQTGLSVAFDLPTQTGYDSDHQEARGEVGKVGVPICHLGDMAALFDGIPLERMNTSMTINATAPWLLALYIAAAEKQGVARKDLAGRLIPMGRLERGGADEIREDQVQDAGREAFLLHRELDCSRRIARNPGGAAAALGSIAAAWMAALNSPAPSP